MIGYFDDTPTKQTITAPGRVLDALRQWSENYVFYLLPIAQNTLNIQVELRKIKRASLEQPIGRAKEAGLNTLLTRFETMTTTPYPDKSDKKSTSFLLPSSTRYSLLKISEGASFNQCFLIAINIAYHSPQIISEAEYLAGLLPLPVKGRLVPYLENFNFTQKETALELNKLLKIHL